MGVKKVESESLKSDISTMTFHPLRVNGLLLVVDGQQPCRRDAP